MAGGRFEILGKYLHEKDVESVILDEDRVSVQNPTANF